MKQKITLVLAAMALTGATLNAQTFATFEDLSLPSSDTSYLEIFTTDGEYPFASGNIALVGKIDYGGTYRTWFNYSNRTNDSVGDYTNQWSAITASGAYNSANYAIAYLESDDVDYFKSKEKGIKLTNDAVGEYVFSVFITNSTYSYWYMKDNYTANDSAILIIRGYLNNNITDSVVVLLAANNQILNDWAWVDLLQLGNIDSITFQMNSTDDFTPFYFAFDDLATTDGCPPVSSLFIDQVEETHVVFSWDNLGSNFTTRYEICVDRTATLAPLDTSLLEVSTMTLFIQSNLFKGTTYYAHVRAVCIGGGTSTWDTISFKTLGISSLNNLNNNTYNVIVTPNPAKESVSFLNIEAASIQVFSVEGRQIGEYKNTNSIAINQYPTGIYFARIMDKNGATAMVKFIKE